MSGSPNWRVFRAYLYARRLNWKLRNRSLLRSHQSEEMQRWRDYVKDAFPRHDPDTLKMDKATLMGDFSAYNLERLTAEEVRQKLSEGYVHHDIACGASTGTSGNRGFYVITDAERYKWLGIILAKALPEIWCVQHRVAIILPQNSALYQTGNQTPRLKVQFHDLTNGPEVWGPSLLEFDPTVIVAPPKVLRWLAENADLDRLSPKRLFSAAETLDQPDRQIIEAAFGLRLGQIYMATEGLLGVTCSKGTLHLTEDYVKFDFDWVSDQLASPILTDFTRRYQLMAGYALNDLLHLDDQPCTCGSPLQPVKEIVGRQDDVFWFGERMVTPDVMRNAVLKADHRIDDFRIQQTQDEDLVLSLHADLPDEIKASAQAALEQLLQGRGVRSRITQKTLSKGGLFSRKLRRIERLQT